MFDDLKQEWYFEVQMIKRIQGTFFEKLELYHFPFDIQVNFNSLNLINSTAVKAESLRLSQSRKTTSYDVSEDVKRRYMTV